MLKKIANTHNGCIALLGANYTAFGRHVSNQSGKSQIKEVRPSPGIAPKVKLNDGREMPALGLGTWLGFTKAGDRVPVHDDEVRKPVEWAIDAGYRHFDTAHIYGTEEQVGKAVNAKIAEGVMNRSDLFITTKLWNDRHAKSAVVPALQESLQKLNLSYVDLYLIHWPVGLLADGTFDNTDYLETWEGMIEAQTRGLTKSIGVSNFNQHMLDRISSLTSVIPAVLQVEINLNLQQPELLAFCRAKQIAVTGYTPLGSLFHPRAPRAPPPPRADEQALLRIAAHHNRTVPQVALRYLVELGVIPIPKSVTQRRIEQNIQVFDFALTQTERDVLARYDRCYRTIPVENWRDSPYYPFEPKPKHSS